MQTATYKKTENFLVFKLKYQSHTDNRLDEVIMEITDSITSIYKSQQSFIKFLWYADVQPTRQNYNSA